MERFEEGVVNIEEAYNAKIKDLQKRLEILITQLEEAGFSEEQIERGDVMDKKFEAVFERYGKAKKELERMLATKRKIEIRRSDPDFDARN